MDMSSAYLSNWEPVVLSANLQGPPKNHPQQVGGEGDALPQSSPGQTPPRAVTEKKSLPAIPSLAMTLGSRGMGIPGEGLTSEGRSPLSKNYCARMAMSSSASMPSSESSKVGGRCRQRNAETSRKLARAASVGVTSYSLQVRRPQQLDEESPMGGEQEQPQAKKKGDNRLFLPII